MFGKILALRRIVGLVKVTPEQDASINRKAFARLEAIFLASQSLDCEYDRGFILVEKSRLLPTDFQRLEDWQRLAVQADERDLSEMPLYRPELRPDCYTRDGRRFTATPTFNVRYEVGDYSIDLGAITA